jgi:hypothetical protein
MSKSNMTIVCELMDTFNKSDYDNETVALMILAAVNNEGDFKVTLNWVTDVMKDFGFWDRPRTQPETKWL